MTTATSLVGKGSASSVLVESDFREVVEQALETVPAKAKVLAVIPDTSRDDSTHILFPLIDEILRSKGVQCFDALVAQGTHPPISDAEKLEKIGLKNFAGQIFDHEWDNADQLTSIGRIDAEVVSKASGGEFAQSIDLTINRLILLYDPILVLGATVPHEVAGFSGGAKYFFPGISGADLTNATHWIGALAGIEKIIGRIETPTRHLIELAADHINAKIINFSSSVSRNASNELVTHALFAGDLRLSFRRAAEVSHEINIKFIDRKYNRVIAVLDKHYTELWTGGKASYKLGGVIEEGGELIIYAPHLTKISETHGAAIEEFGYAPIERIKEIVADSRELQQNLCVGAHLAHVSYSGSIADPRKPKYKITMASGLSEPLCKKVGLGFADHETFNLSAASDDTETLVIKNAGRDLYLLYGK